MIWQIILAFSLQKRDFKVALVSYDKDKLSNKIVEMCDKPLGIASHLISSPQLI